MGTAVENKSVAEIAAEAGVDARRVAYAANVLGVAPIKRAGWIRLFDATAVRLIVAKLANDRRRRGAAELPAIG